MTCLFPFVQLVGLGNHGMKRMRHNVGMMVLDSMAAKLGLQWTVDRSCKAFVINTAINNGGSLLLLKPRVFMNENGKSIAKTGTTLYEEN